MSSLWVRLSKLLRALRQEASPPTTVRRILIAHQLLLGDTLLLAPLLKELQRLYPEAERVVLVRPAMMALFKERPYGVVPLSFERRDSSSQKTVMRSGPYDLALIPDDNRYAWLARAAGARWIIGFADDTPRWKNLMLDRLVPYPNVPAAWADLLVLAFLGSSPEPFVAGEWPAPVDESFTHPGHPYAVLHVGASSPLKAWPADRWNQLARHFIESGLDVVFSGASSERAWLGGIDATAEQLRYFGELDLAQLWHLFANAEVLVCPDTGAAHLGRLAGVRTLALFGPGSASLHGAGDFFKNTDFSALTRADFPCRDQQRIYRRHVAWVRRCGRGVGEGLKRCPEPLCMHSLDSQDVISALQP